MLVAVALVLGFIERMIPLPVPVPGIKLGLSNLVTVLALYWFGLKDASLVAVLRVALGGFLFGSGFSVIYAMAGAITALISMIVSKRCGVGVVATSAIGAVAHNLAQLVIAMLIVKTGGLISYLPILMLSGILTGILTGSIAQALLARVPIGH